MDKPRYIRASLDEMKAIPESKLRDIIGILTAKLSAQHSDRDALNSQSLALGGLLTAVILVVVPLLLQHDSARWAHALIAIPVLCSVGSVIEVVRVAIPGAFATFPPGYSLIQEAGLATLPELILALADAAELNSASQADRIDAYRRAIWLAGATSASLIAVAAIVSVG